MTDYYYHIWDEQSTVTPEMYQFFLATNAANATQWRQQATNIAWHEGDRWILATNGTWSSLPEPIDPDLLMDEGL